MAGHTICVYDSVGLCGFVVGLSNLKIKADGLAGDAIGYRIDRSAGLFNSEVLPQKSKGLRPLVQLSGCAEKG